MRHCPRPARLCHRRPARQGGQRGARACQGGFRRDGGGDALEADHGKPVACRPAQGRLAFRPADRARGAGRLRDHPRRGTGGRRLAGRTGARRPAGCGRRRVACGDGGRRGRSRPDLPQGLRGRGRMGRRGSGLRTGASARGRVPSDRARAAVSRRGRRGRAARDHARPCRSARTGARQTRAGDRRRRAPPSADGRPARLGQVTAGRLPARHHAAAVAGRGAGDLDGAVAGRHAGRRRHQPRSAVPRPPPHRLDGGHRRRRAWSQARRGQPCP